MAHYRRGKPHRDKGEMDRGVPLVDRTDLAREKTTKPAKKPRGYCTKLRAPHDFVFIKHATFSWGIGGYEKYRCAACGKINYVDIKGPMNIKSVAD